MNLATVDSLMNKELDLLFSYFEAECVDEFVCLLGFPFHAFLTMFFF